MAMSGQILSRDGQSRLQPFEQAPRPMAGYSHDYPSGHLTGLHRHPRAQLLFATAGVMRVSTEAALFTVPPGTGLWVPADTQHGVRMDGEVHMRALFLRADAAASGPVVTTVIAVSPLLRELILTVCGEPVVWDARGPMRLVAALVLHEIGRRRDPAVVAAGVPRPAVGAGDRGVDRGPGGPARPGWVCRGRRGVGADVGATVSGGDGHELSPVAAAAADDRGAFRACPGRAGGTGGGGGWVCERACVRGGFSGDIWDYAGLRGGWTARLSC